MKEKNTETRNWVIYKITSPSRRIYIGKTSNFHKRKINYKCTHGKNQRILFKSFKKYGFEQHIIEIIDSFHSDETYCNGKEMFWIRSHMSNHSKWPKMRGMNLTDGGEGGIGRKISDEQKKAHSEFMKANPPKRNYTKHSEETIEKMRATRNALFASGWVHPMQGTKRSPETLKRMSESHKGKPSPHKGLKRSAQVRENVRIAALNRKSNPRGYKISEEGKRNIRIAKLKKAKPIIQYSLDGTFIKEFAGVRPASRELNIPESTLMNLLNRTKKPQGKFMFKYKQKLNYTPYNFQRRIFNRQDIKEKIA